MHSKFLSLVCLLTLQTNVFAQPNGQAPQVSPVTPNEAALFKAEERPLGNYTGTVPVNMPLHTLTCGSLSVPIGLSYHMGGIKLEEIASNVGLGWSLQAGGSVTRLMRGIPDDENGPGSGFLYSSPKPSGYTPSFSNDYLILQNYLDMEPDMYCYNFNGESGQFFFDESGNVVMQQESAIKVEPVFSSSTIIGWIITDEKGDQYYFGCDKNQTVQYTDNSTQTYQSGSSYGNMPSIPTYYTTWHLAEIDDMNGENQVLFTYNLSLAQYTTLSGGYGPTGFITIYGCSTDDYYTDNVLLTNQTYEYYLTRIQSRSEYVQFNTSLTRTDYTAGPRLDSVKIYDSSGVVKTKYHLNYDYFHQTYVPYGGDPYYKRLKLRNIAAFGSSGTDSLTYQFTYEEGVNLPSRTGYGVDYWGFYNGEDANGTILPNLIFTYWGFAIRATGNGRREANADYARANTLTKITYPTGGYRQFTYEGNQALMPSGDQIQPDPAYLAGRSFYNDTVNYFGSFYPSIQSSFTVNSYDGEADFSFTLDGYTIGSFHVDIVLITGIVETTIHSFSGQYNGTWTLSNGNYRLDVYMDYPDFTDVQGYWNESTLTSSSITRLGMSLLKNNRTIGGLRVKQIDDYDPVAAKTYTTKYSYKLYSQDSTLTSGLLVSPVIVASESGPCGGRTGCQYLRLAANSSYPLASNGGAYVYYTEVRTRRDSAGWTDREYTYRMDGDNWYYWIGEEPLGSPADYSFWRGKLITEKSYSAAGTLLKKTVNQYQQLGYWTGQAYKLKGPYGGLNCTASPPYCTTCNTAYTIGTGYYMPSVTTDSIFGSGSAGAQVLKTIYGYVSGYPLLASKASYINNNHARTINYHYAIDTPTKFTLSLSATEKTMKNTLRANHYLQPLEVVSTTGVSGGTASFEEGTKFTYGYFNGSKIHLSTAKQFKTLSDSITTNFTAYDQYGNLTEQYKQNDPKTVWLWGYHGSYPVAMIKGSTYTACAAYVSNAVLQAPSSDAALRTQIGNIRTGLDAAIGQVSTYTYLPLVGMSSETDPSGKITYYEYDNHGRLSTLRDQNRNVVKKLEYKP